MEPHAPAMPYRRHLVAGILALGFGMCGPVHAEASSVEQAATVGGRIIGAAKACGINAERVRKVSERLLSVMGSRAGSVEERESATRLFAETQVAGSEQFRFERSKCSETHVSFSEMEVKLGRAPASDNDPLAAKRGIPALGALRPEAATGIIR